MLPQLLDKNFNLFGFSLSPVQRQIISRTWRVYNSRADHMVHKTDSILENHLHGYLNNPTDRLHTSASETVTDSLNSILAHALARLQRWNARNRQSVFGSPDEHLKIPGSNRDLR